jgi:hypothetical protein
MKNIIKYYRTNRRAIAAHWAEIGTRFNCSAPEMIGGLQSAFALRSEQIDATLSDNEAQWHAPLIAELVERHQRLSLAVTDCENVTA